MDMVSRCSQGGGRPVGDIRTTPRLFADDVVLLSLSDRDIQHALGQFAADCEAEWVAAQSRKVQVSWGFCSKSKTVPYEMYVMTLDHQTLKAHMHLWYTYTGIFSLSFSEELGEAYWSNWSCLVSLWHAKNARQKGWVWPFIGEILFVYNLIDSTRQNNTSGREERMLRGCSECKGSDRDEWQ